MYAVAYRTEKFDFGLQIEVPCIRVYYMMTHVVQGGHGREANEKNM